MIYAVRQTCDPPRIDLFVSERNDRPPPGFVRCTIVAFVEAWCERDLTDLARLQAEAAATKKAKR